MRKTGAALGAKARRLWYGAWRGLLRRLGASPDRPETDGAGRWPTPWQGFLWDLAPAEVAPSRDGVVPPAHVPESWLDQLDANVEPDLAARVFAHERERHTGRRLAADAAEAKASRLLTPVIALLTGTVALAGIQLNISSSAHTATGMTLLLLAMLPTVVAGGFLFVSAIRALDADIRVGMYLAPKPDHLIAGKLPDVVRQENLAMKRASWTAGQKTTSLMHARASLSRAIFFLAVGLVVLGGTSIYRNYDGLPTPAAPTLPMPSASPSPSPSPPSSPAPSLTP